MTTQNAINAPLPLGVANGGTGQTTFTADAVLIGNGASGVTSVGPLTNGQVLIGSTGVAPVAASLTAGAGITITGGAGTLTIASTSGSAWVDETSTTVTMAANTSYIADNASQVVLTLPATAALGDCYKVVYKGAGGWKVAQNAGQSIVFGTSTTTSGTGGYLASTAAGDAVYIVCTTANTGFTVVNAQGNITVA